MSRTGVAPKSAPRVKSAAPAPAEPAAQSTPRERLLEVADWESSSLYLSTIEEINVVLSTVFDVIDMAAEKGTITRAEHGYHAARAGGAACEAIRLLTNMREGDGHLSEILRDIALTLPEGEVRQ